MHKGNNVFPEIIFLLMWNLEVRYCVVQFSWLRSLSRGKCSFSNNLAVSNQPNGFFAPFVTNEKCWCVNLSVLKVNNKTRLSFNSLLCWPFTKEEKKVEVKWPNRKVLVPSVIMASDLLYHNDAHFINRRGQHTSVR